MTHWEDGEIILAHAKDLKCMNLYNWLLNFIHTHPVTKKCICLFLFPIMCSGYSLWGLLKMVTLVGSWNGEMTDSSLLFWEYLCVENPVLLKNLCINSWHTTWHVGSVNILMNGWKNETEFWDSLTCQGSQFRILVWDSNIHHGNGYSLTDNPNSNVVIFSIFLFISKTFMKWEWEHSN